MEILILYLVIIAGLIFGSFLNVCIYRIPKKETIIYGRSHCTACGKEIRSYDLIPILSYFVLRGRCRNCSIKISARYPFVELLSAALYALIYLKFGLSLEFYLYAAFVSMLIIAAFIDIDTLEIPNVVSIAISVIGLLALIFSPELLWYEHIIGIFIASVPLLVASLVSKGGMGFGDIKLCAAAGFLIGFKLTLLSLLIACIVGSVFGIIYAKLKNKSLKTSICFGPFLAGAFCFSILFGNKIISMYISLLIK